MKKTLFDAFFNLKSYILRHKKIALVGGFVVFSTLYFIGKTLFGTSAEARYVLANVEKGNIIVSVSASGQVSASNQVDIKAKTSGDVVYVPVKSGDEVRSGTLLVQLDARDAQKAVRDAQANYDSARLSFEKLTKPAEGLSLLQTENSLAQAKETLSKSYDDGFNSVSDAYVDLATIMSGFDSVLYGIEVGQGGQSNIAAYADLAKNYSDSILIFQQDAINKYQASRKLYEESLLKYKASTRFDGTEATEALLDQTYNSVKTISDALKSSSDFLSLVKDVLTKKNTNIPSQLNTHISSISGYTTEVNSHLNSLLSLQNTISSSKRSVAEKTISLADLKSGVDDLDLQAEKISLTQRENSLIDAKEKLADSYIRAQFDGVVAKVSVKKLDSVSSGTAVVTFITKQKIAEVSLNEVDAAKVKQDQKATITFDAIDGLSISGEVLEVDAVGTVTQGVVTYNIKLGFDTQDDRVKPGMSLSAAIITDIKQDVLTVPVGAIKTNGDVSYVEMLDSSMDSSADNQGVT